MERNTVLKYKFEKYMFDKFKLDVYIRELENTYEISNWGFADSNPLGAIVYKIPKFNSVEEITEHITSNFPEMFL